MRLSNSKERTWRRCPKKYEFKYIYKLRPKKRVVQLERGSWIHDLLMHHYDGHDWEAQHKVLTKKFYALFEEEREELGDLPVECQRIMKSYLRTYKEEDKQYRVVDSELDEIITLPNGLRFQIIVDLILEDIRTGDLIAWDHKTWKNFSDTDSMLLDPQLTRYFWGLQHGVQAPCGCRLQRDPYEASYSSPSAQVGRFVPCHEHRHRRLDVWIRTPETRLGPFRVPGDTYAHSEEPTWAFLQENYLAQGSPYDPGHDAGADLQRPRDPEGGEDE